MNEKGVIKILPILIIIIAVGILSFILISSTAPFQNGFLSKLFNKPSSQAASNASITLPPSSNASQNSTFTIPVMINTDSQDIVGVDLRLNFNKYFLKVIDITPQPNNSSLKTFAPTDSSGNFDKTTVINNANQTGIISLGALALAGSTTSTFNGILGSTNPLVTLTFQALNQGTTAINVSFTSGSTTDSNLVTPQNTDILATVTNDTVSILGVGTPPPSSTSSPSPTPTPVPSASPTSTALPSITPSSSACGGADLNQDGVVNIFDYNILVGNFGKTGINVPGDINGNGVVDIFDYNLLISNYGKTGC